MLPLLWKDPAILGFSSKQGIFDFIKVQLLPRSTDPLADQTIFIIQVLILKGFTKVYQIHFNNIFYPLALFALGYSNATVSIPSIWVRFIQDKWLYQRHLA